MTLRAPAKLNLCLYVGARRGDGLHELRSLFCPLSLADRITVAGAEADEVVCEGVVGPNMAERALVSLRERGWGGGPLRVEIEKRIPVAAGLGGGSADAAAILRLAAGEVDGPDDRFQIHAHPDDTPPGTPGLGIDHLREIAAMLGADVPSQLDPTFALVGGAGERVEALPPPGEFAAVLIAQDDGLATADVYAEADRLGVGRGADELDELGARLRAAASGGASPLEYAELLVNDLQPAALSLRPEIGEALAALREAGAEVALVSGSGPTAVGLFPNLHAADRAAAALPLRYADAIVTGPETFAR